MNFKQRAKARKRLWAGFPLSFEAGDTVIVTAKEEEAWWKGEVGGKAGVFPSNYFLISSVLGSIGFRPDFPKAVLAVLAFFFGFVFP